MVWISGVLGNFEEAITYLDSNLRIAREIGDLYTETYGLINLSANAEASGDQTTACESAQQALKLARKIGDRSAEAWALTNLGHSYLTSQAFGEAAEAYQKAFDIRQELKQPLLATEPAAGLIRTSLVQGNIAAAQQFLKIILPFTQQKNGLAGTDSPLRVYLACYVALETTHATDDAQRVLKLAYNLLQTRAANIEDPVVRLSFLKNIPHHRAILAAWKKAGLA